MANTLRVHVAYCRQKLRDKEVTSNILGESFDLGYNVEQFVLTVLESNELPVIIVGGILGSHHLNDIRMLQCS